DNTDSLPENLKAGIFPVVNVNQLDESFASNFPHIEDWEKMCVLQYRTVIANHDRTRALESILENLNLSKNKRPLISVLASTKRLQLVDHMIGNILKQKYVDVEIHLMLHGASIEQSEQIKKKFLKEKKIITINNPPETQALGSVLNDGVLIARGEFIAKM